MQSIKIQTLDNIIEGLKKLDKIKNCVVNIINNAEHLKDDIKKNDFSSFYADKSNIDEQLRKIIVIIYDLKNLIIGLIDEEVVS